MTWIKVGASLGLLAVLIGAFGAHGLADRLKETGRADNFHTGVLYQMFSVVGILVAGLLLRPGSDGANFWLRAAPWGFVGGILLFSGSLYALALSGQKWWGAVTPLGGLLLLFGWLALALAST